MIEHMAVSTLRMSLAASNSGYSDSKLETPEKSSGGGELITKASDIITRPGTESYIRDLLNIKKY
jgi:hypothetical protein